MKNKVLTLLLQENAYMSGEEIGRRLGISRSAVWKNINKLKSEGYEIKSISNKGYKIISKPDKMIQAEIWQLIDGTQLVDEVYIYDTVGSTNKEAKKMAANGVNCCLIVSDEQTLGKGRRGRNWVSKQNTGIYMSLLLRPNINPGKASLLTLLAGIAVRENIEKETNQRVKIKWPNDIVIEDKKVCGILTEMSSEIDFVNYVVVGIGINVRNQDFDDDIKDKATSIEGDSKVKVNRNQLIGNIINSFSRMYYDFVENETIEPYIEAYNESCISVGNVVRVIKGNEEIVGQCIRVNADGALMIDKNGKEVAITSGEVSVRGLYGYV